MGAALPDIPGGYAAGPRLLDLIGFTGCAVQLDTNSDAASFLHVRLEGPYPSPVFKAGRNTRLPRCPECRGALHDWREQTAAWQSPGAGPLTCAGCTTSAPASAWDWRRQAGVGRTFVAIEEVFPAEGRPLPALWALLERLDAGPWHYFFVQD